LSDEDFNAKEVRRLRGVVDTMRGTTDKLHLKLAQARAYPLIHTEHQPASGAAGDDGLGYATRFIGKVYLSEPDELFDDSEGLDGDKATVAEHKAAQAKRLERAVSIQRDFQTRLTQIRSQRPSTASAASHFKKSK
jgi:hypothetical protein